MLSNVTTPGDFMTIAAFILPVAAYRTRSVGGVRWGRRKIAPKARAGRFHRGARMAGIGALRPVADHAAYGRRCPIPAVHRRHKNQGIRLASGHSLDDGQGETSAKRAQASVP